MSLNKICSDKAMNIDPFVLDFGSSVNISEEQQRTLRSENKCIDDDTTSLQNEHKTEDRFSLQHRKDFSHALIEMNRFSRDAREDLEQVRVREHLLSRLRDSIETEISTELLVVTPSSSPSDKNVLKTRETNMLDEQSSESPTASEWDGFDRNLGTCADNYTLELNRWSELLKKDHVDCLQWLSKILSLEEECALRKAKVDELSKQCHDYSNHMHEIQQANVSANQRVERLREFIEKEKQISAQDDEVVTEQSNALSTMKMEHQSAENQLNQEIEKLARAVESLRCEWKQATETLESSIEQVQTFEADVSALEQLQETTEKLAKEHETAKEALIEKANVLLSLARDFHRSAEELKAANDLEEEALVQPAREELKSLEDQKEHLVLTMTSLREKIQLLEDEDRKYNEEQAILGEQLAAEYENNQDIVASRKAEQESIKQLMDDEKTNFACDVEGNLGLSAGLDEKIKYYQQSIDDVKAAHIAAILKRQDKLRSEHQKHLEIEKMKLQMYERAIAIMAESDEKVKVLRETKTFMVKVHDVPSISSKKRPRDFMSQ